MDYSPGYNSYNHPRSVIQGYPWSWENTSALADHGSKETCQLAHVKWCSDGTPMILWFCVERAETACQAKQQIPADFELSFGFTKNNRISWDFGLESHDSQQSKRQKPIEASEKQKSAKNASSWAPRLRDAAFLLPKCRCWVRTWAMRSHEEPWGAMRSHEEP